MIHHFTIPVDNAGTGVILPIFIVNSSTGAALTGLGGLVYNTAGLLYSYRKPGSGASAVSLITMTLGTWDDGGFKEVDGTNHLGLYEFGLPPEIATVVGRWTVTLYGATNMAPCRLIVDVTDFSVGQIGKIVQAQR
jgi:hypothetical protein